MTLTDQRNYTQPIDQDIQRAEKILNDYIHNHPDRPDSGNGAQHGEIERLTRQLNRLVISRQLFYQ